ncbi:glutathione S-transferase [Baffinella frigidus]|nr:glutathione S-transferase [Cryptophyta sp. CCMP2293]
MGSILKIYGMPLSQPVRAVAWSCLIKRVPFKLEAVKLASKEPRGTRTMEFLRINPSGLIPAMDDNGFQLGESMAILSYLGDKYPWKDLYPTDPQTRAKVLMYFHYHHRAAREATVGLIAPITVPNPDFTPEYISVSLKRMALAFKAIDKLWLGDESNYLVGDSLTLADIAAYSEIGQLAPRYLNLVDFTPYPNIRRWISVMEKVPYHDEVHAVCAALGDMSTPELRPDFPRLVEANKKGYQSIMSVGFRNCGQFTQNCGQFTRELQSVHTGNCGQFTHLYHESATFGEQSLIIGGNDFSRWLE